MLRRIVSSIILVSFISLLYTSCREQSPIDPGGTDKTIFENAAVERFPVVNPGTLHNDVLTAFHRRHSLLSSERISQRRYARILSESINAVFQEHDIPFRASKSDIFRIVRALSEHGARSNYDFFDVEHELPTELFAHLAAEYGASQQLLEQCLRIMTRIRQNEQSPAQRDPAARSFYTLDTGDAVKDEFIIDISSRSYKFWTTLVNIEETEVSDINWDQWEEIKKKYFAFEPDITAAVLCVVIPSIPSLIGLLYSLVASTAFTIAPSGWSPFGHYHTR